MAQNISKYVQINDFLLLEYEFNRDGTMTDLSSMGATVAVNDFDTKMYFNNNKGPGAGLALGDTNNILELYSIPTDNLRSTWFNNWDDTARYYPQFQSYDPNIATYSNSNEYPHDTIKVHIISGYNFDDIVGFMLQVRAEDSSSAMVDLSNFSYFKQPDALGSADVVKFATQALYLGNRFYDKYVEFKIPSVYALGNDTAGGFDSSLGQALNIMPLSDVYLTYSTVPTIRGNSLDDNTFTLAESIDVQLPMTSVADNFNAFIAESTNGDFIEYYATWSDQIIGQYMGDIESGRIPLYTSNNPNDNYAEFEETYGNTAKWVLIHELYVYENLPGVSGGSSLLTQTFSFTQDDNFSSPNLFRPVLRNADIDASYTIQYICRLSNRMDGTQIIRRASFASTDPKKYGRWFTRLNVENIIPYKVFNRIEAEKANIVEGSLKPKTKYVKIFYDTTGILYNENNELYPQGQGPLLLKTGDSVYKFKFEKYNETAGQKENVDLSGAYNYALRFTLDDETVIESVPTYSTNMNTTIGELEFKLNGDQITQLLKQQNTAYRIVVKNPDGSNYTFYEGVYHNYVTYTAEQQQEIDYQEQIANLTSYNSRLKSSFGTLRSSSSGLRSELSKANSTSNKSRTQIANLNKKIVKLQAEINTLTDKNASLIASNKDLSAAAATKVQPIAAPDPPQPKPSKPTLVKDQNRRIIQLEKENLELTKKGTTQRQEIDTQSDVIKRQGRIIRDEDLPQQR